MAKNKIAVVTDSSAYLPPDLVTQYDIHVIPLIVNWEGKSLLDDVDISPEQFYTRLVTTKELPSTSQPSAGHFKDLFEKLAKEYDGIVAVLISSYLSGTVASANAAVEMMDNFPIEIVDTESTTSGLGLMTLAASKAAHQGAGLKEVAQAARDLVKKTRLMFVVDTLEFLHRGGRIGGAKRLMGSVLAIKPILHLVDGKIEPLESVRTKKKAVQTMLSVFKEGVAGKSKVHAGVFQGQAEAEAGDVMAQIKDEVNPQTLVLSKLSPAIGVHTGPGTIGIAYYTED